MTLGYLRGDSAIRLAARAPDGVFAFLGIGAVLAAWFNGDHADPGWTAGIR
jgi:hypothetical protein